MKTSPIAGIAPGLAGNGRFPVAPSPQAAPEPGQDETKQDAGSSAAISEAVEKANRMTAIFHREIHFQLHEGSGRMMVTVVNSETGELMAEIPPKKLLDTMAAIREALGLILDQQM